MKIRTVPSTILRNESIKQHFHLSGRDNALREN